MHVQMVCIHRAYLEDIYLQTVYICRMVLVTKVGSHWVTICSVLCFSS